MLERNTFCFRTVFNKCGPNSQYAKVYIYFFCCGIYLVLEIISYNSLHYTIYLGKVNSYIDLLIY